MVWRERLGVKYGFLGGYWKIQRKTSTADLSLDSSEKVRTSEALNKGDFLL